MRLTVMLLRALAECAYQCYWTGPLPDDLSRLECLKLFRDLTAIGTILARELP